MVFTKPNLLEDYEKKAQSVFQALDRLEKKLADSNTLFILGNKQPTGVNIKLYTTVVRFDIFDHQHLHLMLTRYPHFYRWLGNMYWNVPGIKETTNFMQIKENYNKSHENINPTAITPLGLRPEIEHRTENDGKWLRA